jgi:citrate synthase
MMKDEKLSMAETAKRVVAAIRAEKRRIPGLGHPTHKGDDFRAVKLRKIAAECGLVGDKVKMFEAIHAEFVRVTGRQGLCINVDGMLGALMSEMGFRPMQMAAVALLAVLPGIMAHVIEESRRLAHRARRGLRPGNGGRLLRENRRTPPDRRRSQQRTPPPRFRRVHDSARPRGL